MSKPRYPWWGYIKNIIRAWPGYGYGTPHGFTRDEMDAVEKAVEETRRLADGEERYKALDKIFWAKTHTIDGAALEVNVSYWTARMWHREFIELVGKKRKLLQ